MDAITALGSALNVKGRLTDVNRNPLVNKSVTLFYSDPDNNWTFIGSDTTNTNGEYTIQWNNTTYGTFTVKAEWNGDDEYLGTNATTTLSFLPQQDQNTFLIESNSTVTALTFNTTNSELIFTVSGADGTTGYIKATIPKELLQIDGDWTVLIDGNPVTPTITEDETKTILYFTYEHSTHTIEILGAKTNQEVPTWLILSLFVIGATVTISSKKYMNRKE